MARRRDGEESPAESPSETETEKTEKRRVAKIPTREEILRGDCGNVGKSKKSGKFAVTAPETGLQTFHAHPPPDPGGIPLGKRVD